MTKQTKNEPKFTPGPWFASGQLIFAESKKCPIVIAAVNGLWLLTGNTFEANAALIAAAPEMYALLERVIREGGTRLDIADEILQLLAKARGEDKNG